MLQDMDLDVTCDRVRKSASVNLVSMLYIGLTLNHLT